MLELDPQRPGPPAEAASALAHFAPATRLWFERSFAAPTPVQRDGWPRIAEGVHALLIAPTGSGKTLAAFLWAIDGLSRLDPDTRPGVRVLYISPLKALAYDIERNLRAPLTGIRLIAEQEGFEVRIPRVFVRTGDTPQRARQRHLRHPADILVTTPESLYLLLCSRARETLRTVETVIVDEIHALAPTKRGAHLALSLEHLVTLTATEPQRIGLSATVRPAGEVGRFLGGDRRVAIVDRHSPPRIDLEIVVPVPDLTRPLAGPAGKEEEEEEEEERTAKGAKDANGREEEEEEEEERSGNGEDPIYGDLLENEPEARTSIWPAIYPRLIALIRENRTTIIFVNSRGLCERLSQKLNELAGEELVLAHHGSIAHEQRRQIEEMLKAGQLSALVATSSLELGIDMGAVDLVVLVESPSSVASGLQRVGRAGHDVGAVSVGRLFPKHRGDLLVATVVGQQMLAGHIESIRMPRNPLDVLAQQVVAMCVVEDRSVDELERIVKRAANFSDLTRDLYTSVLDMLSGRYPSNELADLSPRIHWDRDRDLLTARRGAAMVARLSGGTIPDRGLYGVFLGPGGARVGELDEEMVHETRTGQTIILGASSWRIEQITRDQVLVSPAPGQPGTLPFWHGDGPGRPIELGRAVGALTRELAEKPRAEAERWLKSDFPLDELAAVNLAAYIEEQRESGGAVPSDETIVIERFRDELGDWRVCILSPFGSRVHAPWALAIEAQLGSEAGFEVQTLWSDDGIVIRFADGESLPEMALLVPRPDEIEDRIVEQLGQASIFAAQFRENAGRALLMPRRRPGSRTPLWAQRLKSQQLLAVAQRYPSFPIVLETYRSCLQDVFDVPALKELLGAIERREVRVEEVETQSASPFARSLVFAYVADYMYQGDTPLAERRAHALTLDRQMLRELLGQEALRELFDAEVIETVEAELQHLVAERRVRHADGLHDLLRRLGDLDRAEIEARSASDPNAWLEDLERARRVARMRLGSQERWVAVEDVALYRDALGAVPPAGLPTVFLERRTRPLRDLVRRWARTHGPFVTARLAQRFGSAPSLFEDELSALKGEGWIERGDFLPGGTSPEWCDPEVLRRIRRRTLAKLRDRVAPLEPAVLGRFLPAWHGINSRQRGSARLEQVIAQLEGLPLSFRDLETVVLPARVADYSPRMLDDLGASGQLVWVGRGALGKRDGRIALYRRDRLRLWLAEPEPYEPPSDVHAALLQHLETAGASFFYELSMACAGASEVDVIEALFDLVWAGRVTNDTFRALRALGPVKKPRRRPRHPSALARAGGRWSLLSELLRNPVSATERAHARTLTLLERYGIVAREVMNLESFSGGFAGIYPVLKAMEEAGRVRRGYFVEGLGGAQFAYAGAVDRLRASRAADDAPHVTLLAASDPANPYGWLLPWPEHKSEAGVQPRRAAGASIVMVDGELVLYLERSGRRVLTFSDLAGGDHLARAAGALRPLAARARGKLLRIEEIDGQPARLSARAEPFRQARFGADHRGLTLEA